MVREDFPPEACPACGSANIVYNEEEDELTCKDCGLIVPGASNQDDVIEEEFRPEDDEEE